ncbi:hypothetical protein CgunFtcFv8_027044 [Champsocephalus gunnari]|uniref:Uncharacterized protein n=1 Tax=Champsocephalus gunnari TaxID=52237 RepID=A0AAN8E5X7_CHAGU|nr:hypothetical protein CgunFtcFv8_027044 [Champsocephalus gunnari]
MLPRRQDFGMKKSGGPRNSSVINLRTTVIPGSVRRSSAVLPSVLTFLVIVASGGLLLMIEKGMLSSMETPPPRGAGKRQDFMRQVGRLSPVAEDVDSQAQARCHRFGQSKAVKVYRLTTRNYEREMLDKAVLQSMSGNKEGNNNGPVQQFSKKEIEDLLRRGAYAAIMDENDEGNCFC